MPLLQTKKHHGVSFAWLFAALLCLSTGIFLATQAFEEKHSDTGLIAAAFLASSLGVMAIISGLAPRGLIAYPDRLEMSSIWPKFNRTVYWQDVTSWCEEKRSEKGKVFCTLLFKHSKSSFSLSSRLYETDYGALVVLFRRFSGSAECSVAQYNKMSYKVLAGFAIAGTSILLFSYNVWSKGLSPIEQSGLIVITGAITENGTVTRPRKGTSYIEVSLTEFPHWQFRLDGDAFTATNRLAYTGAVKRGDTIQLCIDSAQYHKKLVRDRKPSILDKVVGFRTLDVYSLRDKNEEFLTLADFNKERGDTFYAGCAMVFGIMLLLGAITGGLYKINEGK